MSLSRDEEKAVRSHLLGALEPPDAQALEERLLGDDDFVEQLLLLEDELIEDYARGALTLEERSRFESHFLSTPKRRRKLMLVRGVRKYADDMARRASSTDEGGSRVLSLQTFLFAPKWRAAVFAVLLVAVGAGVWRVFFYRSQVDRGMLALNEAYRKQRPLESRVTGLSYAPFVANRGNVADDVDYRAHDLSTALLLGALSKDHSTAALHAVGRLYMEQRELDKAIAQFQEALQQSPDDAQLHSDMGAALLERARQEEQRGDVGKAFESYALSLEHINKAIQLDPKLPEPLYNRALVLERQMLPEQAKEAWQLYLTHDQQSKWAEEARQHAKLLSERGGNPPTSRQLLKDFMDAMNARDDSRAWQLMSRNREMISGKYLPQQIAVTYLKKAAEGAQTEKDEYLKALNYAGRLDRERAQDLYVSDINAYYERSTASQRALLVEAHGSMAAGYDLCLRTKYKESLGEFAKAKGLFVRAGDEWESRLCDFWVGYCYSLLDRLGESTSLLHSLAEYCRRNNYRWLQDQATTWIATDYAELGEHSKSIGYYNRTLAIAEQIEDFYTCQKVLSQLASQYNQLGQPQRALEYNWRSLALANPENSSVRQLWRNYLYAARTFINLRLYDAAAAFGREMLHVAADEIKEPDVLHYSYHYLGSIYGGLKQYDEAIRLTTESINIARSLPDEYAARKLGTYSLLQIAHLERQAGRCEQALVSYDQAINTYDQMELSAYRYDTRKGRLLCYVALRRDAEVEAELPVVIEQFNQYRTKIREEQNLNAFFDREQSVYDIAIDHAYMKGDVRQAFDYSEASRARTLLDMMLRVPHEDGPSGKALPELAPDPQPLGLSEIQGRIPEGVQVVQYAVLDDKTLIWLVTKDSLRIVSSGIGGAELNAKILSYVKAVGSRPAGSGEDLKARAGELYGILVAPLTGMLDPEKAVCVVPDKAISLLPFASLVSPQTGRYLINDFLLLSAPSLNVFLHGTDASRGRGDVASETLLSVGNPSFDSADFPSLPYLPAAAEEAKGVAKYYRTAIELIGPQALREDIEREIPNVDVIHFAGHYIPDERDPMSSRLVLAKGRGAAGADDGSFAARDLVGQRLTRVKLVILSACQTGVGKYYNGEGVISISRTFLAAGVPLVVASQWAVDSEVTAELMLRFHRYRKTKGLSTVAALRRAQLEMLEEPNGSHHEPYYWAAFLPVGGYTDF